MNYIKNCHSKIFFLLFLILTGVILLPDKAIATTHILTVNNNETGYSNVIVNDTGTITPNLSYIEDQSALSTYTYSFSSSDTDIVQIDNSGNFTALRPGNASIYVRVYTGDFYYYNIFSSTMCITVGIDMNKVTLSTDNVHTYMFPEYYYNSKPYYTNSVATITINSDYIISDDGYDYDDDDYDYNTYNNYNNVNNNQANTTNDVFTYTCSNPNLNLDVQLYNNIITLSQTNDEPCISQITFTIYGKQFLVNYQSSKLDISKQSCLLVKGKKEKLEITGAIENIEWSSSNPTIATVDSNGVVKGKKIGNAIIKAKIGDRYLGCAVSVTKAKIKKVAERATYIGTHWKYSQEKRTQKGYYDCSALVWKAYKEKARLNFGSPGYPGVALSEAIWCKNHNKMIKGGLTYKKIDKMQVNPGDLLFKSSDMKKKYADIYHVEMFTGYFCHSVNSDGSANYSPMWAARGTYYSFEEGSLLGRPMK